MKKSLVFLLVLILSVTAVQAGLVGFLTGQVISEVTGNYIVGDCARDVKVCPDGNYVTRSGPNCEFMSCPVRMCGEVYSPVCGQPRPIDGCPMGAECQKTMPQPMTYSNECEMTNAGATLLYKGKCKTEPVCGNGICENGEENVCPIYDCREGSVCPQLPCKLGTCPQDCSQNGCSKDLKICPDGSKVVRDPENGCIFRNCPEISCGITRIYSEQVSGYVYHELFIEVQGRLVGDEYGITGADNWDTLKFKPYLSSSSQGTVATRYSERTILKAVQTLNSRALAYIMERKDNIELTFNGVKLCDQPLPNACGSLPCFYDGKAIKNSWSTIDSPPKHISANYPYQFNLEEKNNVKLNLRYELWSANDYSTNQMIVKVDGKTAFKISGSQSEVKEITIGELSKGNHFIEIYATPHPNHFHFDWFELTGEPVEEVCSDSDGAKNFYEKGSAYGKHSCSGGCGPNNPGTNLLQKWQDYCVNDRTVYDFTCSSTNSLSVWADSFNCPNGCNDGACNPDIYSCDTLAFGSIYKNAYGNCLEGGYNFMCFNKYGGDFQGCVNDVNECSGHLNTNADKNIACEINHGCPEIYAPVCAQPPMPDCPAGAACKMVMPQPQTYSNECEMKNAGARFLYKGKCRQEPVCGNQVCEEGEADVCPVHDCIPGSPCPMVACQEGTCPQDCNKRVCTDSDGGKNIYVKGKTNGDNSYNGVHQDFCINYDKLGVEEYDNLRRDEGSGVIEHYCDPYNNVANEGFKCENGCVDGACVKKEPLYRNAFWQCYDGAESNEGGETSCKSSEVWSSYAQQACKGHCTVSTCNDRCDFTEDGVIDKRDITEIRNRFANGDKIFDVDKNGVVDQSDILYCSGCLNTKCGVNSFRVWNPCEDEPPQHKCTDSDGGYNYYVQGEGVGKYSNSKEIGTIWGEDSNRCSARFDRTLDTSIHYDCCSDYEKNNQLNEAYCDENGILQSVGYDCPYGCREGACIEKGTTLTEGQVTNDDYSDQEPVLLLRPEGTLVTIFNSGGREYHGLYTSTSSDNGKTWSEPKLAFENSWDDLDLIENKGNILMLNRGEFGLLLSEPLNYPMWNDIRMYNVQPTKVNNEAGSVLLTNDGKYVVSYTNENSADVFVTKTDTLGQGDWSSPVKISNGNDFEFDSSLLQTMDGTYYIAYNSYSDRAIQIKHSRDANSWYWSGTIPTNVNAHMGVNLVEYNNSPILFFGSQNNLYMSYKFEGNWTQPKIVLKDTPFGADAAVDFEKIHLVYAKDHSSDDHSTRRDIFYTTIENPLFYNRQCSDTDKGHDYYNKGMLTYNSFTDWDNCNGNVLNEGYCDNSLDYNGMPLGFESYECPNGCEDGACIPQIHNDICKSDKECAVTCFQEPCPQGVCVRGRCRIIMQDDPAQPLCELVCKNTGTKSEGWYDSCTGELDSYSKCGIIDGSCDGCRVDDRCYPYGVRMEKEFCNLKGDFSNQLKDGKTCQNNYECTSNACVSGVCTDLAGEIRETRSMVERLLEFFRQFF